jgi:hypothetical protein
MFKLKSTGLAGLAGLCLAVSALSADAAEAATRVTCTKTGSAVQDALNANPQSPNYKDAVEQRRTGFDFCNAGMYQKGVDHYQQALKLLGPSTAGSSNNG